MYRATGNGLMTKIEDDYKRVIHTVQVRIVTGPDLSPVDIEQTVNTALDGLDTRWTIGSAVVLNSEVVKD